MRFLLVIKTDALITDFRTELISALITPRSQSLDVKGGLPNAQCPMPNPDVLLTVDLMTGRWRSQILHEGVKLAIFDTIGPTAISTD